MPRGPTSEREWRGDSRQTEPCAEVWGTSYENINFVEKFKYFGRAEVYDTVSENNNEIGNYTIRTVALIAV